MEFSAIYRAQIHELSLLVSQKLHVFLLPLIRSLT